MSGRQGEAAYYAVAVFVGVATGLIGTALHLGTDAMLRWPSLLAGASPWLALPLSAVVAGALAVASVAVVRRFAPEAAGSGVQEVEGAMEGLRTVRWRRVLPTKFVAGMLSLGSGLVLGREGPTIHMGASVAAATAERLRLGERDARGLLAAGAAAGLAAAFSAPLASILFVIEETRRQFPYALKTYTAVMLAAVASGVVTVALTGRRPFMFVTVPELPLATLPAFVALGVVLGLAGVVFNRALVWAMDAALALGTRTSPYLLPAAVGALVGVLLLVLPEATMGGENLSLTLIGGDLPLGAIAVVVLIRFAMTLASYATGVPGGIFAPILALATALGLLFAEILAAVVALPPGTAAALAVAAMGGLFSATVRAPLVGVVLILELTGAYSALVPTLVTCLFANLVADRCGGRPIYETLLDRTLRLAGTPRPAAPNPAVGGWDAR